MNDEAGRRRGGPLTTALALAVLLLAGSVALQVGANALDLNPLLDWEGEVPLLGGGAEPERAP